MGREPLPYRLRRTFPYRSDPIRSSGISQCFHSLSQFTGQVTHVLLTRLPLIVPEETSSFDLHALSAPLAFILSHDQTLRGFCSSVFHCLVVSFTTPYFGFLLDFALLPITFQLLRCCGCYATAVAAQPARLLPDLCFRA
jgi:hypothetical protein